MGSEKRRRNHTVTIRLSDEEHAILEETAERTGYSKSYLFRRALLSAPPPRARPRPSIQTKQIARVLAQLGKIGSNINQLAKYANLGRTQSAQIELALRELGELRLACLQALGMEPAFKPSGSDDDSTTSHEDPAA